MSFSHDLRVCIIGAGPSGLCSLRHILASSQVGMQVVLFEQQADIGGVWNYSGPEVKLWDAMGNPMVFPMYNNLRCNLPRQLMEFRDFKQKNYTGETFATQQELHDYLVEYADNFNLWPYFKLNRRVVEIKRNAVTAETSACPQWMVTVENTRSLEVEIYSFDAIMCCVGVNYVPKIPNIPDMNMFQGRMLHSKYFKTCDEFWNKRVVLVGLGPSSADLSLKLAQIAKSVTVCHRSPGGFSLGLVPKNVRETKNVKFLKEWSVVTEDDEEIPCEVVILCTGYEPSFPFLDFMPKNNDVVYNLYKKMLVPRYPSFCFINAHALVSEFLVMEIQAKYFVALLEGRVSLPPIPIMESASMKESQLLRKSRSQGKLTEALKLGDVGKFAMPEVQQYLEGLAVDGGFAPDFRHIPLHLSVWQWVIQRIFGKLAVYRGDQLKVLTPTCWEYSCAGEKDDNGNEIVGVTKVFKLNMDCSVIVTDKAQK